MVVAAVVLGMGGLAHLCRWRDVSRYLLTVRCGIVRARFTALAA
jgi:hypothetical protein